MSGKAVSQFIDLLRHALAYGMVGLIILALAGCAGGGKSSSGTLSNVEGTDLETQIRQANAQRTGDSAYRNPNDLPGGINDGSVTAEDIAAQLERDMQDLRSLHNRPPQNRPPHNRSPQNGMSSNSNTTTDALAIQEPNFQPPQPPSAATGQPLQNSTPAQPNTTDNTTPDFQQGNASDANPADVLTANNSLPAEVRMQQAMVSLRRELFQNASYADSPLREYLVMAALAMVDPDKTLNPDALNDLNDRERDILRAYQDFFVEIGRDLEATGDETVLVEKIEELRQSVTNTGPLTITRAAFCTSVTGFGAYDTFDKNVFLAGRPQDVIVYTEVDEFRSVQNEQGQFVTDLWIELVIYNSADQVPVWSRDWSSAPDVSERQRRDFYINYVVTIPERLSLGQYTMKVRVRDDATGSIAESGIDFQIVADPKLATAGMK